MTEPVETIGNLVDDLKERRPIIVIEEDILPGVSSAGDVINRTRVLNSQRPGHEGILSETAAGLQDLTPLPWESRARGMVEARVPVCHDPQEAFDIALARLIKNHGRSASVLRACTGMCNVINY